MKHKKNIKNLSPPLTNRYALDRTALANERTYLAWIRSGLASLAGGLAIEKYLGGVISAVDLRFISTSLIVFSILAFIFSAWRYRALHLDLNELDITMLPVSIVAAVSFVFASCSIAALISLWKAVP